VRALDPNHRQALLYMAAHTTGLARPSSQDNLHLVSVGRDMTEADKVERSDSWTT